MCGAYFMTSMGRSDSSSLDARGDESVDLRTQPSDGWLAWVDPDWTRELARPHHRVNRRPAEAYTRFDFTSTEKSFALNWKHLRNSRSKWKHLHSTRKQPSAAGHNYSGERNLSTPCATSLAISSGVPKTGRPVPL